MRWYLLWNHLTAKSWRHSSILSCFPTDRLIDHWLIRASSSQPHILFLHDVLILSWHPINQPHFTARLLTNQNASLTDDDVLEDVGVVVRCGCHLDSVRRKKHEQQGNKIQTSVSVNSQHPVSTGSISVPFVWNEKKKLQRSRFQLGSKQKEADG